MTDEQVILFTLVGEVVRSDLPPWAIGDIHGEHRLCRWRGLVFNADNVPADIVGYMSINARPVHCFFSLYLHLVYPLMGSGRAAWVHLSSLVGMQTWILLRLDSMDSLPWAPQRFLAFHRICCLCSSQHLRVKW